MATRLYTLDRSDTEFQVTETVGAATTESVEVTIDLADNLTKAEIFEKLDMIKNHILKSVWPPA